jgi:transposase InsO family protein
MALHNAYRRHRSNRNANHRKKICLDSSLPGLRVARELDALIASRGRPVMCVSDNGTELTGMAILRWSRETRVEWHYIAPSRCTTEPTALK